LLSEQIIREAFKNSIEFDVIIVGSGIAGLYSALHIDEKKKCAIVTKAEIDESNSWLAQGGIAAVMTKEDNAKLHIEDTLKAGAGLCKISAVEVLVNEGPENIRELVSMDVPFDVDFEGELQLTREGGHRLRRIVHCGGDATGRETTKRLGQLAMNKDNISVLFHSFLVDILTDEKGVCGVIVYDGREERYKVLMSVNVVIATGGIGQLYEYTTNPVGAVGDGIACAVRAGVKTENMEMIQFHPTTLMAKNKSERQFLISEAVRGEGAILKNKNGEAFMAEQHDMADLAPRDIVTRCILKEMKRTGENNVYLDCSSMSREFFKTRFPTIFAECDKHSLNLTDEYIPVRPAQHYFMGGIATDLNGMTNVEGLYACGEVACTGIHGANRLASNSLLECLVFGRRCARDINVKNRKKRKLSVDSLFFKEQNFINNDNEKIQSDKKYLKKIMTEHLGAVRNFEGLMKAKEMIDTLLVVYDISTCESLEEMELVNMITVAKKIVHAALLRKESIGAHYLED